MVNEDLRKLMEEALVKGDNERALKLSQILDKQIAEEQRRMLGNTPDDSHVYHNAIKTFGANMQKDVAIEEMSELIKEIIKHKRGSNNRMQIAEEIVDVEVMLEQLKIMFGISKEEDELGRQVKTMRLYNRIQEYRRDVPIFDMDKVLAMGKEDNYREEKITKEAAKDLGINGDTIKLRPGTALVNTTEGWKVVDI